MPSDAPVAQQSTLRTAADLLAALGERGLEHLDVDDHRTVVLYREAVLNLTVTNETLMAAQAFTIASQGFVHWVNAPDPEAVIANLCRALGAVTDTDYRYSHRSR